MLAGRTGRGPGSGPGCGPVVTLWTVGCFPASSVLGQLAALLPVPDDAGAELDEELDDEEAEVDELPVELPGSLPAEDEVGVEDEVVSALRLSVR